MSNDNCGCDSVCRSLSLLTGDKGDPGANGLDGTFGANSDLYIFSTATVGNPKNTKLIFDNANVSAATSISVSNVDGYGNTVAGWLNLVGTSDATLKAFIRVNKEFDSTTFAMYAVTAQTANAGYYTYTITYVGGSSNSPFALNDNVIFSYVISGNNGAAGANGVIVIVNDLTQQTSNSNGAPDTFTWTIPANTMVNDGDFCELEIDYYNMIDYFAGDYTNITTVDSEALSLAYLPNLIPSTMCARIRFTISRISATSYWETQEVEDFALSRRVFYVLNNFGGFNFTTDPLGLSLTVFNAIISGMAAPYGVVGRATLKYFPKI